jgi:hypothetical protein
LLLIAEHLQGRFAEHGEEERRTIRSRQREHDLLHKGRLAGARRPCNHIERELGHAPAQDGVETGDARR